MRGALPQAIALARNKSSMTHLSKRLAKLEASSPVKSSWSVSAAEVDRVALALLSETDRDLVEHARDHGGVGSLCRSDPAVWNRWEAALAKAFKKTGFPVQFNAIDWEM